MPTVVSAGNPVLFMDTVTTPNYVYSWGDVDVANIPTAGNISSIISTVDGGFAALDSNGAVYSWGYLTGTATAPTVGTYKAIAATKGAYAALSTDGKSIAVWGDETMGGINGPDPLPASTPGNNVTYLAIAATDGAFAALKSDGTIAVWGDAFYGGASSDPGDGMSSAAPSDGAYMAIAASSQAFAAVKEFGTGISVWGALFYGGAVEDGADDNGNSWTAPPSGGTMYNPNTLVGHQYSFSIAVDGSTAQWGLVGDLTSVTYGGVVNSTATAVLDSEGYIITSGDELNGGVSGPTWAGFTLIKAGSGSFSAIGPADPTNNVACFLLGTPVLTPNGYVPIETIARGDIITTSDGRNVHVTAPFKKKIWRTNEDTAPYFIPANCLAPNVPVSDIVCSPGHAIQIGDDRWLAAFRFAKRSDKVKQIHLGKPLTYYCLMVPNYFTDNLVVFDGVVVESMNPRTLIFDEPTNAYRRVPKA